MTILWIILALIGLYLAFGVAMLGFAWWEGKRYGYPIVWRDEWKEALVFIFSAGAIFLLATFGR